MSHAPVEVLEEDAADLQFPKESAITVRPTAHTLHRIRHYVPHDPHTNCTAFFTHRCRACATVLREPYIQCAECPHPLCVACFAGGREVAEHRNNHAYTIRHDNVRVFAGSSWTAGEEKQLLSAIERCGHGNWSEVARSLNARLPAVHATSARYRYTAAECQAHYERHYFGGLFEQTLGLAAVPYERESVPFLYRMNSVDPPRQEANPDAMAGYRAARGEFDVPYDNSAETMVSDLDAARWGDDEGLAGGWRDVGEELQCAVMRAYNNRLRERQRRYDIMRDHGLLMTSRTLSWLSKHSEALGCGQASASIAGAAAAGVAGGGGGGASGAGHPPKLGCAGRFISLMQLCEPIAFDLLVEAMQYAHDLRKYVFRLYELRRNGVRTFHGGRVYHRSRARRLSKVRNKREELYAETWEWKQLVPAYDGGLMMQAAAAAAAAASAAGGDQSPTAMLMHQHSLLAGGQFLIALAVKRKSTPLEVLGLPGYDKLTEAERELCSTVRLVPHSYLGYKSILMAENSKSGYLRLADARRLIKIDVNKTRQLYDFLLKQGFINKLFN